MARLQSAYIHYKEIKAAQGVKIIAKDLDKSLAGLPLYVASNDDEVEYYKVSMLLFQRCKSSIYKEIPSPPVAIYSPPQTKMVLIMFIPEITIEDTHNKIFVRLQEEKIREFELRDY